MKNSYVTAFENIAKQIEAEKDPEKLEHLARAFVNLMSAYTTHLQAAGMFFHARELFDPNGEYAIDDQVDRNAYESTTSLN